MSSNATEVKHSKIDQMKMKHQKTYSEDLFEITHAPEHQCSNIDKLIKIIRSIDKMSGSTKGMDEDDLISGMDDINREIWDFDSELEKLRSALEDVREWGQGWKDKCKTIINESEIDVEDYM